MRLLLLNQFYLPDLAPTGRFLHDLGAFLAQTGHEVEVVCSSRAYDGGQEFEASEVVDAVSVNRVPACGFGRRSHLGKLADYSSFILGTVRQLNRTALNPDLILSLTTPPYIGLLGRRAARKHRCQHAHWIMDLYPDVMAAHGMLRSGGRVHRQLGALTRRQLQGASSVIALGPCMADRVGAYRPKDLAPSWIPLWSTPGMVPWPEGRAVPLREARGWASGELVLAYSGNMGLGHRFGEFLQAARQLGPNGPRWAFFGGGKRRKVVEDFATAHPSARIEVHPYVEHEQLGEHLAAADVHLVSLEPEWQGLMVPSKIHNLFAVGRPVLFVGGQSNEIAHWIKEAGAGWVVPPNDVPALLQAVSEARNLEARRRMGEAAAAFAQKHFDRDTNCRQMAEILMSGMMREGLKR